MEKKNVFTEPGITKIDFIFFLIIFVTISGKKKKKKLTDPIPIQLNLIENESCDLFSASGILLAAAIHRGSNTTA